MAEEKSVGKGVPRLDGFPGSVMRSVGGPADICEKGMTGAIMRELPISNIVSHQNQTNGQGGQGQHVEGGFTGPRMRQLPPPTQSTEPSKP